MFDFYVVIQFGLIFKAQKVVLNFKRSPALQYNLAILIKNWPMVCVQPTNNIRLSHKGEVNSGGYIARCKALRYIYPPLFTDPEGIVVLVFTKSDDKKIMTLH